MKKILLLIVITVSLNSCDFGAQGTEVNIVANYYIGWQDLESNRCIYKKESAGSNIGQIIVDSYVFAIGHDSRYIIAKSSRGPALTLAKYHIIDTRGYYHTDMDNNNYWEFSSEKDFYEKLQQLKISNIEFDNDYQQK